MSYEIEYQRKIFKFSAGTTVPAGFGKIEHVRHENDYFMFIKSGCNNIDPGPEEWYQEAWGWNYQIIGKVCKRAAWAESGCLKLTTGNISPETYLRMYRKEIKNAADFSLAALKSETGIYGGYLCIGNNNGKEKWISGWINEIKKHFTPYGEYRDHFRYDISFSTEEQFHALIAYASIANETGGYIRFQSLQNKSRF